MADAHGAAYNHSPQTNGMCGDLPWMGAGGSDDSNGFVGIGGGESRPDGDNDSDDIGSYPAIPSNGHFMGSSQRGFQDSGGGWS